MKIKTLEELKNSIPAGIEISDINDDYIVCKYPITNKVTLRFLCTKLKASNKISCFSYCLEGDSDDVHEFVMKTFYKKEKQDDME